MGYLIGGAGEGPEQEIVQSDKDYSKLTDAQLLKLRDQTVKDIAKFNNFQMVRKICLNSAYGAIGNEWFRYYKLANAEAITTSGQTSIRWIENKLNKYINELLKTESDYVIAVSQSRSWTYLIQEIHHLLFIILMFSQEFIYERTKI